MGEDLVFTEALILLILKLGNAIDMGRVGVNVHQIAALLRKPLAMKMTRIQWALSSV